VKKLIVSLVPLVLLVGCGVDQYKVTADEMRVAEVECASHGGLKYFNAELFGESYNHGTALTTYRVSMTAQCQTATVSKRFDMSVKS